MILINMALEGLNAIIRYFSNNDFQEVVPYSNSIMKEAPVQGVGFCLYQVSLPLLK